MQIYDTIFVGFGPATIFSLLEYPQDNCLIIEKGKSLRNRDPKEVIYGSGGAGAFSDSKLVANPLVGGELNMIAHINDNLFFGLSETILDYYNRFNVSSSPYKWNPSDDYEIGSDKLRLLKSKVCHIGTDGSKEIFTKMEDEISKTHEIHFEEEVLGIEKNSPIFQVYTTLGVYLTKKVVMGVGKRSKLVTDLAKQLNLKHVPNRVQLGVRVECPNIYLKELVDRFYDFKIVMNTKLGRWRTFCVNSGSAHVAIEKGEGFVSANGHAFSDSRVPNTSLTNFGLMGELNLNWSREFQLSLMRDIVGDENKIIAQNIKDFLNNIKSKKLEHSTTVEERDYRLGNLWAHYPIEVCLELKEFILEIKKHFELEGHFFAPEIKLTNPLIDMTKNLEIYPGVHLIGDCSGHCRSIIQAGISGMLVGEHFNESKNPS